MKMVFRNGQICKWYPEKGFVIDNKPIYIVGVNYVSRHICTNFWEDWRPELIKNDLENISKYGLNAVRIPVHWEYSEPRPGKYNPEIFKKFDWFLTTAEKNGLFVMPFFLVGTCTQFYDVRWRKGRSFLTEPMVTYAVNNVKQFVKKFKNRPNILCWDICDEPEFYSILPNSDPLPYKKELIENWVRRIYTGIKEIDNYHCVNVGFSHISSNHWGINVRNMAKILDCMTVTCYPPYMSTEFYHSFRNTYFVGWNVRFNDLFNKGVFSAEAPGGSNAYASEESIANYYRVTLYSNLINGSFGTLPWVWNDYDVSIHRKEVLNTSIHEPYFGISRKDGTLKPAGKELSKFSKFIDKISIHKWVPVRNNITILIPENYYEQINSVWAPIYHSYMVLRSAGLFVNFIWEEQFTATHNQPVFIPAIGGYTTSTWYLLADYVKNGGTLYCSYSGLNQLAASYNELFGIEVHGNVFVNDKLKIGYKDDRYKNKLDNEYYPGKSILVIKPKRSRVIAETEHRIPFLIMSQLGNGKSYLVTYPIEAIIASNHDQKAITEYNLHKLYFDIAQSSGIKSELRCINPEIESGVYRNGNRALVILVNHSNKSVETEINTEQSIKRLELVDTEKSCLKLSRRNKLKFLVSASDVIKLIIEF